jgi:hypothetical protein
MLGAVRAGAAVAEGMGAALPGVDRSRWQELANKLTAYRLFVSADSYLSSAVGLPAALRSITRLDSYSRVWATEGLGWYWADRRIRSEPRARLFDRDLPSHALIPLHTGAGLALAQAALARAGRGELRGAVEEFRALCRTASIPGYEGAAFEALGLVTITLYPEAAAEIGALLTGEEESGFFWHGAGRGAYFSPLNFVPLAAARRNTVERFARLPTAAARDNGFAGFAWATTLVNIRHPEVLQNGLRDLGEVGGCGAVASGIASALAIWRQASPGDPYLERWSRHEAARDAALWFAAAQQIGAWGCFFRMQSFFRRERP